MSDKDARKGAFGGARLPVARAYVWPAGRRGWMLAGGAGAAALLATYLLAENLGRADLVSGGPLASAHAGLETRCEACHASFGGVQETRCSTCHDVRGDGIGAHTFARHALYGSGDPARVDEAHASGGPACAGCHREHDGRDAPIARVEDRACSGCHFGSFTADHPEFAFAATGAPDDSSLIFTHIRHTQFVLKELQTTRIEEACLACHTPEPGGKNFEPVAFDPHCGRCHLTGREGASMPAGLPSQSPPGVATLTAIKDLREPGTLWAFSVNDADFASNRDGSRIKKVRLVHRDPWVLTNLRLLRRELTGDRGLADLIPTSGLATGETTRDLYREMLERLLEDARALRGRPEPEVGREMASLDSLANAVRRMLAAGPLPPPAPWLARSTRDAGLDPARRGALLDLVDKLTGECRVCHVMDGASMARVQKRQRALLRAEFDHAAHVIDTGCLDCHRGIPMTKEMAAGKTVVPLQDRSSIQNLPVRADCAGCHRPGEAADRCVTCHLYHPDPESRTRLLLSVDRP